MQSKWCMDKPCATNFHMIHHGLKLKRTHLSPYKILCDWWWGFQSNGKKSWDLKMGVSKISIYAKLWVSQLCKFITTTYKLQLKCFHMKSCWKSFDFCFLSFSNRESNYQFHSWYSLDHTFNFKFPNGKYELTFDI